MALSFCDSFDHYATADILTKYTLSGGGPTIEAGQGRTGAAIKVPGEGGSAYFWKTLDSQNTWIIGYAVKVTALPVANAPSILIFDGVGSAAKIQVIVQGTTGYWIVADGAGAPISTSSTPIPANTWIYVEFKVVIHLTAGSYALRVNGATVLSGSGINTATTGNAFADGIILYGISSGNTYIDDLYICDGTGTTNNNFIGDVTVKAVLPDAAGNYAQFTPSAGSNYQNVDDAAPDGDSTYNGAADAGKKDSYNFGAVGLTGPVMGVQTVLTARKDIGGSKIVKDLVRISGTDYNGSNASLTDAYKMHRQIHELNPATSANWTIAQIDAAEFGVEVVS